MSAPSAPSPQHVLVILPTYNRAPLLPTAIESVLEQDYPHKKLVVVDDGSTDDTAAVCRRYLGDSRGAVSYVFKPNGGCASGRNKGLQSIDADTAYVCFVDSDDRLLPGKLSREVALLAGHPEAQFTYADSILFEEETGEEELRKAAGAGAPDHFALRHFLTLEAKVSSILYRAEVFKTRRFREDTRYNDDSDFLQRLALESRGVYCDQPSSWIRSHAGSQSRNLVGIYRAVIGSCREILHVYPDFHRAHTSRLDERMEELRLLLVQELMQQRRHREARAETTTRLESLIVAARLRRLHRLHVNLRVFLREPQRVRRAYWMAHIALRKSMGRLPS